MVSDDLTVVVMTVIGLMGLGLSLHHLRRDVRSRSGWAFFLAACSLGAMAAALHVRSQTRFLPPGQQPDRLLLALFLASLAGCVVMVLLLSAENRMLERELPRPCDAVVKAPTAPEEGVWPPPARSDAGDVHDV